MLGAFSYAIPKERELPPRDELDEYVARIKPYGDAVIVEVDPDEPSAGAIVIREAIEQSPIRSGRVLALGPGRAGRHGRRIPLPFAVGDRVCFPRGDAYVKATIAGREIRFLREDQLEQFVVEGDGYVDAKFVD